VIKAIPRTTSNVQCITTLRQLHTPARFCWLIAWPMNCLLVPFLKASRSIIFAATERASIPSTLSRCR
jgi:hypothetical protein